MKTEEAGWLTDRIVRIGLMEQIGFPPLALGAATLMLLFPV